MLKPPQQKRPLERQDYRSPTVGTFAHLAPRIYMASSESASPVSDKLAPARMRVWAIPIYVYRSFRHDDTRVMRRLPVIKHSTLQRHGRRHQRNQALLTLWKDDVQENMMEQSEEYRPVCEMCRLLGILRILR
uniref:Uncharacterized protein n=1 Tax=Peronospora matthiolae TaxID=2874970 RepID=A0AAV1US32_9STRA